MKTNSYPLSVYTIAIVDYDTGLVDSYLYYTTKNKEDALDIKDQTNGVIEHNHENKEAFVVQYGVPSILEAQLEIKVHELKKLDKIKKGY